MLIFPAVDIKEGRCVRLIQGRKDQETVYSQDPAEIARQWERQGAQWVHVVDLDGAFSGIPRNQSIIKDMVSQLNIPVQLGGGIRDMKIAASFLNLGVSRIIIGTKALDDRFFIENLLKEFGPDKIVIGIDARNGMVAVKGWVDVTEVPALDLALEMKSLGITRLVYTDISRDGELQGPNLSATEALAKGSGLSVIGSGGVTSVKDIVKLRQIPGIEGAIIGKALYEGRITLGEALNAAGR
ncbi:MAG: 1-(5-phosphoribosyl)-5-[(5-phosphoribosylamino)methylideneamino]imidazole-4-carboxamide isomerase [Syntrophomonadaceae bacterium]|nr:1-(5-phosphoribosyl)-5-[(5-phosphoribosylamino)methylideneamino]imidazole-4-carboxamide isomerase [Syntrophomonadaceae bacterium]